MTDALLEIADGLYGLAPGAFTAARDALVKEHKADKALAAAVKALKKPSTAAWVVNLLVRREGEQVDQVLSVGSSLREAAAALDGEELRALTRQRRQLTAAVTGRARAVAADEGVRVTDAVAEQVEATLTAAMLDAGAAEAVRSGLLVAPLAATGVDAVDVAAAVAAPEALGFSATPTAAAAPTRPDLRVVPDPEPDETARRQAEEALASTEAEVGTAQEAVDDAAGTVQELSARVLQLQSEMAELRTRLAELEDQAEATDDELADAEESRAEADAALADAVRERDAAQTVLDALD